MTVPFAQALETGNLASVLSAPKADYHCHCYFGTRIENVERWLGYSLDRADHSNARFERNVGLRLQGSRSLYKLASRF